MEETRTPVDPEPEVPVEGVPVAEDPTTPSEDAAVDPFDGVVSEDEFTSEVPPVEADAETPSVKEASPEDDPSQPYRVGRWHNIPNYECRQCPYSTVEGEADILWHIAQHHGSPPAEVMQAAGITLYDQWGHELPRAGGE